MRERAEASAGRSATRTSRRSLRLPRRVPRPPSTTRVAQATTALPASSIAATGGWPVRIGGRRSTTGAGIARRRCGWPPSAPTSAGVTIDILRRTSADPPDAFSLLSLPGVELQRIPVTFDWEGARNADMTGPAAPRSWRVAAVNQFGRTLCERRPFTLAPRVPVVLVAGLGRGEPGGAAIGSMRWVRRRDQRLPHVVQRAAQRGPSGVREEEPQGRLGCPRTRQRRLDST